MVVFVCRTFTVPERPVTVNETNTETENSVDEGTETEGD